MALAAEICPHPPFDFQLILQYLCASPSTILEVVDGHSYRRILRLGEALAEVAVRPTGTMAQPRLRLEIAGPNLGESHLARAVAAIEKAFDTERDTRPLTEIARRDLVLGELIAQFPGLRPIMIPDPFEALIWAIIGQQVNTSFARKTKLALVGTYGQEVELSGRRYRLFPTPQVLARLAPGELRPLQFSRQKESYIRGIAQAVVEGKLNFQKLADLETERALEALMSLRGVGRWTAEYMLLRGLGHTDVIPAADGGLRRIIGLRYYGRTATEDEVRKLAESWRGWRGYATFYWWLALQALTKERG